MNWINPRDQLPEVGRLVWIINVENITGERMGLPSAEITIGQVIKNIYDVIHVEEIYYKGYPNGIKSFFSWRDWEKEAGGNAEITAWCYYDDSDLPTWNNIGQEESEKIMMENQKYLDAYERKHRSDIINDAKPTPYFIRFSEIKPVDDGVYVVVNKGGVWLSRYEASSCDPWIAPNGDPVVAYYPMPQHF